MNHNFLEHFYNRTTGKLNLDFIKSIPEIDVLNTCEQNPKWHAEGNAFSHTMLAYEKLENEILNDISYSLSESELTIIRAAVILHDIGKGVTTTRGKDGNWHSYQHEIEGEKIARFLLWNEEFDVRETICALIRYHMEPLRIFEHNNWFIRFIEIGCSVCWKFLYYVKKADLLGSIQSDKESFAKDLQKLEFIKDTAISLGMWEGPCNNFTDLARYSNNRKLLPWLYNNDNGKVAYIMIGLPGSGKNTYIDNVLLKKHPDAIQISRDDIRIKLGYCNEGEKYIGTEEEERNVTHTFNEIFDEAVLDNKPIILNNIHLKEKYRTEKVLALRGFGFKVIFVYIEAPTLNDNYNRRDGQITKSIINKMALSFEYPRINEYDELIINKQWQ